MIRLLALLASILVFAAPALTPALALDLPTRKAGLWELKMVFEGRNLPDRDRLAIVRCRGSAAGAHRGPSCPSRRRDTTEDERSNCDPGQSEGNRHERAGILHVGSGEDQRGQC